MAQQDATEDIVVSIINYETADLTLAYLCSELTGLKVLFPDRTGLVLPYSFVTP